LKATLNVKLSQYLLVNDFTKISCVHHHANSKTLPKTNIYINAARALAEENCTPVY